MFVTLTKPECPVSRDTSPSVSRGLRMATATHRPLQGEETLPRVLFVFFCFVSASNCRMCSPPFIGKVALRKRSSVAAPRPPKSAAAEEGFTLDD